MPRSRRRALTATEQKARAAARPVILKRVGFWAGRMNVQPKRIAIRDQRSRWGSASALGNVNFSWRVTRMPAGVQDYIIIHELAHLREMNHSRTFWAIVAEHSPDYQEHRHWLHRNGARYHRRLL